MVAAHEMWASAATFSDRIVLPSNPSIRLLAALLISEKAAPLSVMILAINTCSDTNLRPAREPAMQLEAPHNVQL